MQRPFGMLAMQSLVNYTKLGGDCAFDGRHLPDSDFAVPFQRLAWDEPFRYLGILFKRGRVAIDEQRSRILAAVKQSVESWRDRNLSRRGRVLLLNTFALSRLWFAAHAVPFDRDTLRQLNAATRQFLWKGRRSRVSLERVTQSRAKGGLGLLPAGLQSQCLLAKWFGRVYGQDAPGWCALGRAQLQRHLVAAGLSPHALLAPEKRKGVNRLPEPWRSRVKA
ncbi:hypothetical protein THASP1DRAFT_25265, partial [Thamnocephalis sphaerospora]